MTTPAEQIQLDSTHHNLGYFCKTLTNSEDMRLVDLSRIELYYFTLEGGDCPETTKGHQGYGDSARVDLND